MNLDITEQDKAYLAGIIDGEGCIFIHKDKPRGFAKSPHYSARLSITQANKPFLDSLKSKWSVGSVYGKPVRAGWRPQGIYEVSGKACMYLLEQVLPYLTIKKSQAEGAIELERSLRSSSGGKPLTKEELDYREWVKEKISELNQQEFPWV